MQIDADTEFLRLNLFVRTDTGGVGARDDKALKSGYKWIRALF
jgi:hypothetical protein